MKLAEFVTEQDEFERKDFSSTDRIRELKRTQDLCSLRLQQIMDKWHALATKGLLTKTPPTKGGSWMRIPDTMALSGKWYFTIDLKEPEAQRLYKYVVALSEKENEVIARGRAAFAELQELLKELASKISDKARKALNSQE